MKTARARVACQGLRNGALGFRRSAITVVGGGSILLAGRAVGAAESGDGLDLLRQLSGVDPTGVQVAVRLLILVTVFSIVPSILLLTTSFPRILILLSFVRRALGAQDLVPNPVVTGMAFVLTAMVMMPVWTEVHDKAYVPLRDGRLKTLDEAVAVAEKPLKRFMLRHTRERDLLLMHEISRGYARAPASAPASAGDDTDRGAASADSAPAGASTAPESRARGSPARRSAGPDPVAEDPGFLVVLPAFVLSELKTAGRGGIPSGTPS